MPEISSKEMIENGVYNSRSGQLNGLYDAWRIAMMVQGGTDVAASIKAAITARITHYRSSESYPFDEAMLLGYPQWMLDA